MNEPQSQHDWLEEALREQRYLDDAGFTARVVAALPRRQRRAWVRSAVLGGAAVAGCVVALVLLPAGKFTLDCVLSLATARTLSAALILPALLVAGLVAVSLLPVATEK
jgi:MFS superfamily sulfate permease-like transporter